MRKRLFDPLGMTSTSFWARPEQIHRLTTAYAPDPVTGEMRVLDAGDETSWWSRPPAFPSASAWLLSTIDDLWRFARMMLHMGEHEGHQVVSAESVQQMCTDHLTVEQRLGAPPFLGAHESWGLGLAVPAADDPVGPNPAGFGWNGGTGTTWRSDPSSGRSGILLTQRAMTSPVPPPLFADFWACVAEV